MNSNLQTSNGFKQMLLTKLSYAITCSVISYLAVVFIYIFLVNFNVELSEWFKNTFNVLTSFSTWLHIIPFATIIFAQFVICAKDYVFKRTYKFTRFQKCLSIFSLRTFILAFLHVAVGGLAVWLYLSLTGGQYQDLYIQCKGVDYCLVEGNFFMILSGFWSGIYFFVRVYITDKSLIFPVVQQSKLLHFKANFLSMLKKSKNAAIYPAMYYFVTYYICGSYLRDLLANMFKLHLQKDVFSLWLCIYVWIFTVLYILNMNLMRFFFELFLTEPIEHPLMSMYDNDTSLSEALLLHDMPIVQHLACLDLYLLSLWSPQRRQTLFTLSQPGGHPHNWNRLITGALKLITEFTEKLDQSTNKLLNKDEEGTEEPTRFRKELPFEQTVAQRSVQRSQKFINMRNLSSVSYAETPDDDFSLTTQPPKSQFSVAFTEKLVNIYLSIKRLRYLRTVKYIFDELPEVHIQQCLKNGQLIVWTTQGIANVAVASLHEDPYGIVQKDLPILITSLVKLKQSVEKLSKVPEFSRKGPGFDDFSFKMKNSVNSAVKRSLCNICRTFCKYLYDIPLQKDVVAQLQCYL